MKKIIRLIILSMTMIMLFVGGQIASADSQAKSNVGITFTSDSRDNQDGADINDQHEGEPNPNKGTKQPSKEKNSGLFPKTGETISKNLFFVGWFILVSLLLYFWFRRKSADKKH